MIKGFLKKLLDDNEKEIRKYSKTVEIINRLEPQMTALPEAAFPAKTQEFKQRLENGESLNDILPEAFALVRKRRGVPWACAISMCSSSVAWFCMMAASRR